MNRKEYFANEEINIPDVKDLSPVSAYTSRPIEWFKDTILGDFVSHLSETKDVLDVGCAYGYYTVLFTPFCKTVTGIDFTKKRIEAAQNHWKEDNIKFVEQDLTIPFTLDKQYDVLFTSMVIQHIPIVGKIAAFKNLATVTKKDGLFIMYDFKFNNVTDDFVGPINPDWIHNNVGNLWECESCVSFCREANNQGEIFKYVLRRL
jgi:2-polyprenyl-3-methyl-5-hydroxy-6-metoxy-1,4-benzoquinol methylase